MKSHPADGTQERMILAGLIYSPEVLARVGPLKNGEPLLASPSSELIANLCLDFCKRYKGKAPSKNIANLFQSAYEEHAQDKQWDAANLLLGSIVDEYESTELNIDLIADIAGDYIGKVSAARLLDKAKGCLDRGQTEKFWALLTKASRPNIGEKIGSFVLNDPKEFQAVFDHQAEPIVPYEDGLAEFFGGSLQRDSFVGFQAGEGTGKSWWLLDIVCRTVCERLRVALFEVGDMSRRQVYRRLISRIAHRPWRAGKIRIPVKIRGIEAVDMKEKEYLEPMTPADVEKARDRFVQTKLKSKRPFLWVGCWPNSTINVAGIRSELDRLAKENDGWSPDVVVIDYADILAPPSAKMDTMDAINETWKQLRCMSQELHCLVVTATQAKRESYDAPFQKKKYAADDKRKLAHVSYMAGITVKDSDKVGGIMRLNWVKAREMEFRESKCCYAAGCLAIGHPSMCSIFWEDKKE